MREVARGQSQPRDDRPGRRLRVGLIGIALADISRRYPMVREHQMRALAGLLPVILDAVGQGAYISRILVVVVDEAGLRKPAPALQHLGGSIEHRTRRRRAVLRI